MSSVTKLPDYDNEYHFSPDEIKPGLDTCRSHYTQGKFSPKNLEFLMFTKLADHKIILGTSLFTCIRKHMPRHLLLNLNESASNLMNDDDMEPSKLTKIINNVLEWIRFVLFFSLLTTICYLVLLTIFNILTIDNQHQGIIFFLIFATAAVWFCRVILVSLDRRRWFSSSIGAFFCTMFAFIFYMLKNDVDSRYSLGIKEPK